MATALPLLLSLAATSPPAADLAAGERIYFKCVGCHSPDRNRTGPLHCGLLGRAAAAVKGYDYSEAMRESGIVWTAETLDRFLANPLAMVPGSTMGFAGIADTTERENLVGWLATLDASSPLCEEMLQKESGGPMQ